MNIPNKNVEYFNFLLSFLVNSSFVPRLVPFINWGYFQLLHSQPAIKVDQSYKVRKIIIYMDTNSVSFIVSRMEEIIF